MDRAGGQGSHQSKAIAMIGTQMQKCGAVGSQGRGGRGAQASVRDRWLLLQAGQWTSGAGVVCGMRSGSLIGVGVGGVLAGAVICDLDDHRGGGVLAVRPVSGAGQDVGWVHACAMHAVSLRGGGK